MDFLRRLGFFLVGFSLGLFLIIFFFKERILFSSYFPNKRILNHLKNKEIILPLNKISLLEEDLRKYYHIDFIKTILLEKGKVDFKKSKPRKKPFPLYHIYFKDIEKKQRIYFIIEKHPLKAIVKNIKKEYI